MTDVSPAQIGKYKIVSVVGEGAMGTVYRAVDSVIGRTVAIKVMNAAIARDKDHRERFLREAQSAGSLQHPNVVTIFDLGELDGHLFIAMEFLHGADLEKLIVGPSELKLQEKLDIIVDVLMGLSYAHKNGIIHRDIKPANIRVGEDGKAKIMDFGVAHLASSDMTRTGLVVGTPSYMAPEQVTGGKAVPGTDIFAVGAVLYHLLSGSKPFEAPTLQSLFYRIVTDMPRPLDEIRPGLPPALNRIVQKAMAKDPQERYQSALDMANAIISVRAELSGNPYASTASLSSSLAGVAEAGARKTVPITVSNPGSWKKVGAGAGAAAAVLIAWLAFAGTDSGKADELKSVARDTAAATPVSQPAVTVQPTAPPIPPAAPSTAPAAPTSAPVEAPRETSSESAALSQPAETEQRRAVRPGPRLRQALKQSLEDERLRRRNNLRTRAGSVPRDVPVQRAPVIDPPVRIVTPPPPPPPPPPAAAVTSPIVSAPPPSARPVESPPPPAPRPAPRDEIAAAVAAYASAIESRDMSAVRRAYPGITADQARGFEQFFQSARNINVTFRVMNVEASGNTADARLVGTYSYVTSDGRTERQPVSFEASLRYDGSVWQLRSVR